MGAIAGAPHCWCQRRSFRFRDGVVDGRETTPSNDSRHAAHNWIIHLCLAASNRQGATGRRKCVCVYVCWLFCVRVMKPFCFSPALLFLVVHLGASIKVPDSKRSCLGYRRWHCGRSNSEIHGEATEWQGIEDASAVRLALQESRPHGSGAPSVSQHSHPKGNVASVEETGRAHWVPQVHNVSEMARGKADK